MVFSLTHPFPQTNDGTTNPIIDQNATYKKTSSEPIWAQVEQHIRNVATDKPIIIDATCNMKDETNFEYVDLHSPITVIIGWFSDSYTTLH